MQQKKVWDTIVNALKKQMARKSLTNTRKICLIQRAAVAGRTYVVTLLLRLSESKRMLTRVTTSSNKAASLCILARTLHGVLELEDGEELSTTAHVSVLYNYDPRSKLAFLLRHLQFFVLDDVYMLSKNNSGWWTF